MRTFAIYGKGGIGKSTVASNLSVSFAQAGMRVLQIGCDPKHDSCHKLVRRQDVRTVMSVLRDKGDHDVRIEDIVLKGRFGVDCVETGGPEPGVGCAGRGITRMFEILELTGVLRRGYDIVIYDVLGDVVCGGFAAPIRAGYAQEILIVASGEVMALYAANNICRAAGRFRRAGAVVAGVVGNLRGLPHETEMLARYATKVSLRLFSPIARDTLVQEAERAAQTVSEYAPESPAGRQYHELYQHIHGHDSAMWEKDHGRCQPMDDDTFEDFVSARVLETRSR